MRPARPIPGTVAGRSEFERVDAATAGAGTRGASTSVPLPFVREELASKSLYFSLEDVQSRMQLQRPDALDLAYTRTMMGFLLFAPAPARILMVGLGGGSLAKFCFRHLPHTAIDVVEVNPHVIALRDEFRVPPDGPRFHVIEADGATFMETTAHRYDVVLLDAFGPQGLPAALGRQRFYDDCADTLLPGGVLVANLHSAAADCAACAGRIGRSFEGQALVVEDRRPRQQHRLRAQGRGPELRGGRAWRAAGRDRRRRLGSARERLRAHHRHAGGARRGACVTTAERPVRAAYQKFAVVVQASAIDGLGVFAAEPITARERSARSAANRSASTPRASARPGTNAS